MNYALLITGMRGVQIRGNRSDSTIYLESGNWNLTIRAKNIYNERN